jgi:LmbE family N-acetylglucosaminyl deacetylase
MCVLAHPDDESLGMGGTLAKYAAEGIETYLVTATRGERGWWGEEKDYSGLEARGRIREEELRCAAQALGIREVNLLGYIDGDLDQADGERVIGEITVHLRRLSPDVVVTFAPEGAYGRPDHIAISQLATAALIKAAFSDSGSEENFNSYPPHRVSKLYYMAWTRSKWSAYESVFGNLVINIDGTERHTEPWPDWAITQSYVPKPIGQGSGRPSPATNPSWSLMASSKICLRNIIRGSGEPRNSTEPSAWSTAAARGKPTCLKD